MTKEKTILSGEFTRRGRTETEDRKAIAQAVCFKLPVYGQVRISGSEAA